MKVTIKTEELRQILSAYFRMEVQEFELIATERSPLGRKIRDSIRHPLDKTLFIGNIKMIRNISNELKCPMTLVEGKWAIENWVTFINFVDAHNRFPAGDYGTGPDEGILR